MTSTGGVSIREAAFRVVVTDGTPMVCSVSDGVRALLGYEAADFLSGKIALRTLIHRDDQDIADTLFSPSIQEAEGDANIRVRQAGGRIRCVKAHYRRTVVADGVVVDVLLQDAKSLPRTMENVPQAAGIAAVMENTDDYICFKDRNHVFTGANQTMVSLCSMDGHSTDLMGQTDYDVLPEELADAYYRLEKQVFAGAPVAHEVQETLGKDGKMGWVDNRKYPIRDASGALIGLYGIARDITAYKQTEAALRDSEYRWRFAIEGSGDGLWDWNVPAGTVFYSTRWKEMLGYADHEIGNDLDEWRTRVHPDDVARVMADVQAHLAGTTPHYATEHRIRCKDGQWKWILDRGVVVERDAAGQPVRVVGTHADITQRMLAALERDRAALAERSRRALLSALEDQQRVQAMLMASLREKEALLSEVHHRVKNNLQIVASLLRLESAQHSDPNITSVLGDLARRIHTMALLHAQLHRSASFSAVDLGAYLEQLSRYAFGAMVRPDGAIQLQLQLTPVTVSMDQAVSCGLLVNELISNAVKHGFPAGRIGQVRVELLPVDRGPAARVSVSDTGVGLPADFAARRDRSLGLQLATGLARQLGGTLDIGPGPETVFSVTFAVVPEP